jgi:SusD family.
MNKYRIIYLSVLLLVLGACKKDFLDKTPDEDLGIEDVFANRALAMQYLTNVYSHVPEECDMRDIAVGSNPFVGAADEVESTWSASAVYQNYMNIGSWSASDNPGLWAPFWRGIRKTNIFLENVDRIPISDLFTEANREQWRGEVYFLRAFYHFLLLRLFGPIPTVDKTLPFDTDFSQIKRQPVQQVVNFIVQDCEQAALLLKYQVADKSVDAGRATAAAALALKARVLLYMASPLWNALKADGQTRDMDLANFTDGDGDHLFPQQVNPNRWRIAADAAKQCIDQCEAAGYGLYYSADNDPMNSYAQLFLENHNKEVLWAKNTFKAQFPENQASPNGMGGTSGTAPIQELVDEYEMQATGMQPILGYNSDGTPIINAASGYVEAGYAAAAHPQLYYRINTRNMYVGRDPRFYASINFNGQYWRTRRIDFSRQGTDGADRSATNFTKTGYLMRKMSSPAVNIPQGIFDNKTWIFFRLGEQYLNYAEALNEAEGPVADVYKYVNLIRTRAGMPNLPTGLNQDEMRERIRHERRIELAFETHRYFDTHRWRISEITQNMEIHGLNYLAPVSGWTANAFYERKAIEKRVFVSPRHYFWPIPLTDIVKNPQLVQNPGW